MFQMENVLNGKITKFLFNKEYVHAASNSTIYYYQIWFDGDDKPWTVGFKQLNPEFLKNGETMHYTITNQDKRSIRKATPPPTVENKTSTYVDNSVGLMVGNALTNAATLVSQGITDPEKIREVLKVAQLICEYSTELKQEFANNKN